MSVDNGTSDDEQGIPPPTAPLSIGVSLRGFADRAAAERFGDVIANAVRAISSHINMERLDGITVAFDYDQALAELDRGYQASRPLARTASDQLVGVAMAPTVLRNGTVKSHMVFHAPFVLRLEEEDTEGFRHALYLVAHECGHVEDLKYRDEAFPGTILQCTITDAEDAILAQIADALWEEYAASRASAVFGREQTKIYEESFASVLAVARNRANAAIRSYRVHANINRVLEEAGAPLFEPLRLAAYLIGHLDGLSSDFSFAPQARDQLAASPYESHIHRLGNAFRELWSQRGRWASPSEFDVLKNIARDVLAYGGMILRRLPDGRLYVDIPFTPDTTPV